MKRRAPARYKKAEKSLVISDNQSESMNLGPELSSKCQAAAFQYERTALALDIQQPLRARDIEALQV